MRRIVVVILLSLLLALPALAHAQASPWQAVFYVPGGAASSGELVVVTTAGINRRIPLPQALTPSANTNIASIKVSSDLRYAAVSLYTTQGDTTTPTLAIADLATGACCTYVLIPTTQPLLAVEPGAFSPDNTQFAVAYVSGDYTGQIPFQGGMAAVNAVDGAITGQISMEQARLNTQYNEPYAVFAFIPDWRADGVRFIPSCYACEGTMESPMYIWNPATNQVSAAQNEYYSIFGDMLGVTRELLYTRYNAAFPMGMLGGMFEPANTVEYYPNGVPLPFETRGANAPVVYFDPARLDLNSARWVLDGAAFVVQNLSTSDATLVYRTGARQTFPMSDSAYVLTGTPDGWLTLQYQYDQNTQTTTSTVTYARVVNGQVADTPLLQSVGDYSIRLVYAAPLGATASGGFVLSQNTQGGGQTLPTLPPPVQPTLPPPPPVQPTLPPPPPIQPTLPPPVLTTTCPGFMPSRLVVGRQGIVTPGTPNRLRAQPSSTAQIIGQIPGGGIFAVIGGPVCDPTGIAWWQVNYSGVVGWTAEGQGSVYYVEPL